MSGRQPILLREYEETLLDLAPSDVRDLTTVAGRALIISPTEVPGRYRIKANCLVGTIATNRYEVMIVPKIPLQSVFLLLEPSKVALDLRSDLVGFGHHDQVTPAFASFFARLLEHTLARGMRSDYVPMEESLLALRGRISVERLARQAIPMPTPCRFDEYSSDTPHNRVLKAALIRLLRVPGIGDANRDALRHLLMWFGEVGDIVPSVAQVLRRGFSRLEQHSEPAVRLACLVLEERSLLHAFGTTTAGAFLIDMNKVFEKFIEARLAAALRGVLEVRGQASTHLDDERRVRMQPDLWFGQNGRAVLVGDAKYKVTKDINGVDSDLYQLLAYTTALGVPEGVLVYAQSDEQIPIREVTVGKAGKRLHVYRIDLSGDAAEIRRSVETLARWIADRSVVRHKTGSAA